MSKWRWQDYANVLIGAWVVTSPWVFGFADTHPVARWNAVILGAAIAVIATVDMEFLSTVGEWLLVALGAWAIASPWVFGFAGPRGATVSMVAAGTAVVLLTLWEIASGAGWFKSHNHAHGQ
jgi:SPW repeat